MPRRRSAPSYIVFDRARGAWDLRFRYVDSIGRVHWRRERSPHPKDMVRSRQWAPWRRAEIIREIEAEVLRVEVEAQRLVTVRDLLHHYETDCRERGTQYDREAARVKIALQSLGADTPARDLTAARIAAWRTELREGRSLSPRSCNAYVAIVRAALNLAVDRGLLQESPLKRLRALPEPQRQPPALAERQVAALLAACRVWERWERPPREDRRRQYLPIVTRVLLGYYTGGRPEAIDALRWRDIDLARELLVIPETKSHRNVVCPLDPELTAHLRAVHTAHRPAPDDLVLLAPRTRRAVVNWRPPWERLLRLANRHLEAEERIPLTAPLHALRHSRITHLLLAGTSPQVVAQVTGTSLVMLQKHYAHVMVRGLREELDRARQQPSMRELAAFAPGHKTRPNEAPQVRQERDTPQSKSHRLKLVT